MSKREIWLTDVAARESMYLDAWTACHGMANCEGWPIVRGVEAFRNIARFVMGNLMGIVESGFCGLCNGKGLWGASTCHNCGGIGRVALGHAELARIIQVEQKVYAAVWLPRIDAIESMLKLWSGL